MTTYDKDILMQLKRIANSLEKIAKSTQKPIAQVTMTDGNVLIDYGNEDNKDEDI